ncbi:MAG: acyltransferase [Gemmatimonadetes bacterium]|nr:acyltransferase [Gemmatimonadota bacterium]
MPVEATPARSYERSDARTPGPVKRIASLVADLIAIPMVLLYRITILVLPDRVEDVFQGYSQWLGLWPGYTGVYVRRAFYRRTLDSCSANCYIGFGTLLVTPHITIGHHVYIGARCMIAHSVIGDDVLIGSNVDIVAGRHTHDFSRLDVPVRVQGGRYEPVTIGRDAWIGNGAMVLADVGEQAVLAAGVVVANPVAPRAIVVGNPARVMGERGVPKPAASSD